MMAKLANKITPRGAKRDAIVLLYFTYSTTMAKLGHKIKKFFRTLGPGMVTGAADDDPSGIATYTQTGAQFGYGHLWMVMLTLPLMTAVQEACARIGAVTGKGLSVVIKQRYSPKVLYSVLAMLLIANTINIGANLGAMGAAAALLVPVHPAVLMIFFTALILVLEIFVSYKTYARILKWLALALLAYPITVFMVHQPWLTLLKSTLVPYIQFDFAFLFIITAVLGTTISPYMFFWEASQETEEVREKHITKQGIPHITKGFMRRLRLDNFLGMLSSQIAMWSILVVGGTVLHSNGITNIGTVADAARALEPLVSTFPNSGFLAQLIFSAGIIGLGLLAVPVLSASASYALAGSLEWKAGLNRKLRRARGFYAIITVATVVGLVINFIGINPIKALVFAAVLNGVIAVPMIFIIARLAEREDVMGDHRSRRWSRTFVWLAFVIMTAAALAMFYLLDKG
jgi:NRAMP (natural resistance-associated macrophage protein)-like metal ion transporter